MSEIFYQQNIDGHLERRSRGCDFCATNPLFTKKPLKFKIDGAKIELKLAHTCISLATDKKIGSKVKIKFCPICGRELGD